jgi:hypothetical protein
MPDNKPKKIYYARCYTEYGSQLDKTCINKIKKKFPNHTIVDPATLDENTYKKEGMEYFLKIVRECDVFVYKAQENSHITAGVARELLEAYLHGKQIERMMPFPITPLEYKEFSIHDSKVMNIEETREYVKKKEEEKKQ